MREITYADAIREALSEEMRADPSVFLLGEDIGIYGGAFGVTKGMVQEFGEERVRDTPLSEHVITGAAAGAALTGMRPVVEIMFSDFLTIAMEQLANQAAKSRYQFGGQASVPMVLRTAGGSGTGAAEQHSQSLEAWVCHVPGLKVVIPSTPADAKGLLKSAIRDPNPVVFIEQKLLYRQKGPVAEPGKDTEIPLGVADVKRPGRDLTVVTYGRMVPRCLDAAGKLAGEGIDAEVIDIRTLVPLDKRCIIESVMKTGRVMVVHEACQTAGYGAEIAATIADSEAFFHLDAPIRRVAGLDVPIPYNPQLEAAVVPTLDKIMEAARDLVL
ncbi:MAG TPA: alpha-ketoacid dehydrogenase subunit beta [Spirochaetia bacterium]|nr:alpha-ketoacid dehydrogenase subunit beta [Spirochaetia bacterium]